MGTLFRGFAAALMLIGCISNLSAQQSGVGTGGAFNTGTDDTGSGGVEADGFGSLEADEVFSAVERADTVGANTATVGREDDLGSAAGVGGAARGLGGAAGGLGGLGGGLGGFGGLGNLFGGLNTGTQESTRPPIRTRLRSAINVDPMPVAKVQSNALGRFRSLSARPALRGVNVSMQGRTAVLSGVVASDSDRRMGELLLRLEPGVSSVDNQLVVSPPSPGDRRDSN